MAEKLGISAPYLNLIEHNKRTVTAELLLKLADAFGLELSDLMAGDDNNLFSDLMEAFSDTVFAEHDITNLDIRDLVNTHPAIGRSILALYDAFNKHKVDLVAVTERLESGEDGAGSTDFAAFPADAVSDFAQTNKNYFPKLEAAADRVRSASGMNDEITCEALIQYIETVYPGMRVLVLPSTAQNVSHGTVRQYDPVARTLVISELLPQKSRKFQIAHQIGLMIAREEIEDLLDDGGLTRGDARSLGRIALANYFAAALLMPYDSFLETAKSVRHDIEILEHRFDASFEQVCHRLTTLHKPGAKGVPFHLLRVDIAGNTSKRFSTSGLSIPRHGGACPRWNVYSAFMSPGRINAQLGQLPDGSAYFCIACTVHKRGGRYGVSESYYSIGLGCAVNRAKELVYSDEFDLKKLKNAVPMGISCRICERMDCRQRAVPPIHHRLDIDENLRGLSAYVTTK